MDISSLQALVKHLYRAAINGLSDAEVFRQQAAAVPGVGSHDEIGEPTAPTMTEEQRKNLAWLARRAERYVSLLIWGDSGVGKSEAIRELAYDLNIQFKDLRLGQLEIGDLIGLPRQEETFPCPWHVDETGSSPTYSKHALLRHLQQSHPDLFSKRRPMDVLKEAISRVEADFPMLVEYRTVFSAPDWFPRPGTKGILLLDELNRSHDDVRQAIFQLILDRKMHDLEMPSHWIIIAAVNPPDTISDDPNTVSGFRVKDIGDRAFLARFLHVALEPSLDEWLDYAAKTGVDLSIRATIDRTPAMLGVQAAKLPGIRPTPRSWVLLNKILPNLPEDLAVEVAQGLVGVQAAVAWRRAYVMGPEAKPVRATEMLADYKKIRPRLEAFLQSTTQAGMTQQPRLEMFNLTLQDVVDHLDHLNLDHKKLDPKQAKNLALFLMDLYNDQNRGGFGMKDVVLGYMNHRFLRNNLAFLPVLSVKDPPFAATMQMSAETIKSYAKNMGVIVPEFGGSDRVPAWA